jgi:cobalamin biosynthesis Mg chelatase CobN
MNALKTGIHAKSLVLPTENLADLQQLIDEYYQHHHPASPEARIMLDEIIRCEWTLRRLGAAETQLFEYAHQEAFREEDDFPLGQSCMDKHKAFGQLQWRVDSTRRALYRALHTLQQLEAAPAWLPRNF